MNTRRFLHTNFNYAEGVLTGVLFTLGSINGWYWMWAGIVLLIISATVIENLIWKE